MRVLLALITLASCVRAPQHPRPAIPAIVCKKGDDCELKWGRALEWVTTNSTWKIRQATDALITTEGPFDTMALAYTVVKTPQGDGTYTIVIQAGCGNAYGCFQDPWQAARTLPRTS